MVDWAFCVCGWVEEREGEGEKQVLNSFGILNLMFIGRNASKHD